MCFMRTSQRGTHIQQSRELLPALRRSVCSDGLDVLGAALGPFEGADLLGDESLEALADEIGVVVLGAEGTDLTNGEDIALGKLSSDDCGYWSAGLVMRLSCELVRGIRVGYAMI